MKKIIIYTKEKVYNFNSINDKNYNYALNHVHREDGPAFIKYYDNNKIECKEWYINAILHRENEPTVITYYKNGNIKYEEWWINGKLHNENGPAIIQYYDNSDIQDSEYFLKNKKYTKYEFNQKLLKRKLQLI